ncbi:hypothetical protein GQR36_25450 [Enterococcus termitis]
MFFFEHGKNEKYIIDNFPPTTYQEKYNDSSTSTYSKSDDSSLDVQKQAYTMYLNGIQKRYLIVLEVRKATRLMYLMILIVLTR